MLKKIGAITAVDALTKVIGYLLLPVYLGLMPKVEFGEFGFLISALGPASSIIGLSLYVPLIKNYCALNNDLDKQALVSTIFIALFVWLLLINFSLFALKPLFIEPFANFFKITSAVNEKYFLMILLINSGIAMLYCFSLLMARKSTKEIILFTLVKFALVTVLNLAFLYLNPWQQDSVFNRLLSMAVADLVIFLAYVLTVFRPLFKLTVNKTLLKANLITATPLIPSAIIGLFIAVIDRRLIAQHHGLADLANYNLAMQALAPIQMLMSAVQVAWAPHLFSIKDNRAALNQSVRVMIISLAAMVPGALLLSFSIYMAVNYGLIPAEYEQVPLLIIFSSVGVIASALVHLNNNMFVQLDFTVAQLVLSLLLLAANWCFSLLLVPAFSIYGAAVSTGAANILILAFGLILIFKKVKREKENAI